MAILTISTQTRMPFSDFVITLRCVYVYTVHRSLSVLYTLSIITSMSIRICNGFEQVIVYKYTIYIFVGVGVGCYCLFSINSLRLSTVDVSILFFIHSFFSNHISNNKITWGCALASLPTLNVRFFSHSLLSIS